jgi:hypothetical protein
MALIFLPNVSKNLSADGLSLFAQVFESLGRLARFGLGLAEAVGRWVPFGLFVSLAVGLGVFPEWDAEGVG